MDQTSNKVGSVPPVIFHTMPVALSIPISSSGDWIALRAASLALDFPEKFDMQMSIQVKSNHHVWPLHESRENCAA